MDIYLGVDVGSVTAKLALTTENNELVSYEYLRTYGRPISALQQGLKVIQKKMPVGGIMCGVGATGSARYLVNAVIGADVIKNEITAQFVGAMHYNPDIRTIIEIGGQDSKLILIRDGIVTDFAMNTVCAAGTGSFLDQQATRLGVEIEQLGELAVRSDAPVHITGSCTVFAESDMIYKHQIGYNTSDIVYGLCQTLVRNYLCDVVKGKVIAAPVTFQGGVAFNKGVVKAFSEALGVDIEILPYHEAMGAIGMALLAREGRHHIYDCTSFHGFGVSEENYQVTSFKCDTCIKTCEIAQLLQNGQVVAHWGGRCDLWEGTKSEKEFISKN